MMKTIAAISASMILLAGCDQGEAGNIAAPAKEASAKAGGGGAAQGSWIVGRWVEGGPGACDHPDIEFFADGRAVTEGGEARWEIEGDRLLITFEGDTNEAAVRRIGDTGMTVDGDALRRC